MISRHSQWRYVGNRAVNYAQVSQDSIFKVPFVFAGVSEPVDLYACGDATLLRQVHAQQVLTLSRQARQAVARPSKMSRCSSELCQHI